MKKYVNWMKKNRKETEGVYNCMSQMFDDFRDSIE